MNPVQNKKIEELKKKRQKLETEFSNGKTKLAQQKQLVERKEAELKQVEAELFSALLVENGLTFDELESFLSESKSSETATNQPTPVIQSHDLGGE
ncbi:hypothetical protein ACOJIU_18490 (plasmid) [Carnobacterium maltaromaticum]|uniref:type III secretion system protein PrgM n=1 Tax=Carnobacterium maltaromaticum TaxID=2751 RepID=UPI00344E2692